jgi:hypothetical protein
MRHTYSKKFLRLTEEGSKVQPYPIYYQEIASTYLQMTAENIMTLLGLLAKTSLNQMKCHHMRPSVFSLNKKMKIKIEAII